MNIDKYIETTNIKNVFLIPTGPTPPNPIELLDSEKNAKFIEKAKDKFDIIILDCPPVIGLSDALVITKFSDVNIVVVSNKKTKFENLDRTKKIFEQANKKIDGVIINKAQTKQYSYYSYYTNDDYYRKKEENNDV